MNVEEYFSINFNLSKSTNGWFKFNDILDLDNPNDKLQAVVNFDKRWIKNFNSGLSTSIFKYIAKLENKTLAEVYKMLNVDSNNFISKVETIKVLPASSYIETKLDGLPKGYINIARGKSLLGKRAKQYLKGRGFNIDKLSRLGVGYIKNQKNKYFGYIIFPFYEHGELVYFTCRNFIGSSLKHKFPAKGEEVKLGKSEVLYNFDALNKFKTVYLVEGVSDALTVGSDCIAACGWSLSKVQIAKIFDSRAENLILIPDREFYKKSLQNALKLSKHKKVKVLNFDKIPIEYGKDVNETGIKIVMKHIKKLKYLNYSDIILNLMA